MMSYKEFLEKWGYTKKRNRIFRHDDHSIVIYKDQYTGMYQSYVYLPDGNKRWGKKYPNLEIAYSDIYEQIQTYL